MYLFNKTINKLLKANVTVATAESCTGGLLSYSFIKNKGVSKIFKTGFICYSNISKIQFLKIKKNTLKKYGAVSHKTSKEMTQNLSKITGCDLSITTTGISGPTGDSKNKSIGLVYIGIKYKIESKEHLPFETFDDDTATKFFSGKREELKVFDIESITDIHMKLILDNTDPELVFFEMDIFWTTAGGANPIEYLKSYPNRYLCIHLKDMSKLVYFSKDGSNPQQWIELLPYMTNVGNGILDIKQIVYEAKKNSVKHFFVEQDMVENPKIALQASLDFLKNI